MNIQGAIFDLDGTLMDSMFIWDTIGEDYLKSRGITPEKGLNEIFKTMSIMQAAQYYKDVYGLQDSIPAIIDGVNAMIENLYANVVPLKDGVAAMLREFHKQGVKMCVATATDRFMVEASLKRHKIDSYFTEIFTCTEVGFGKDSPEIFKAALACLDTPKANTVIFEDAIHAIKTAKSAGFCVAGIYDRSSHQVQEEIKALSDYYIPSFEDWSDYID